jgi:DNA-binding NarL/FixJ family response regulator
MSPGFTESITQIAESFLEGVWKRLNVLIVDDSRELQKRLAGMLRSVRGLNLIGQAHSVAEARQTIKALQPDVVVLDLQLSDGNGIEVLRETKLNYPSIRFIVFTNYCELQYRQRCADIGADYFLCKSTDARSLITTTEDLATVLGH